MVAWQGKTSFLLLPDLLLPYGMSKNKTDIGVAWNNYDCFVGTTSGKDTLHDTVDIYYQSIINETQIIDLEIQPSLDQEYEENVSTSLSQ